ISCELLGAEGVENLAEPIYLNAQIHTTNTATGEHALLAATAKQIQPGRTGYRLELEFRVPSTGRYQLQIVAFLLQAEARIAYHQGPFLRVIPQNSLSSLPRVAGK
ncbi:MAG: hypothetical protein ONA90_01915, partial [candidate division KSB1 bacterium]|nr:hypothetical protein [candidate division KSB1 bacterium]